MSKQNSFSDFLEPVLWWMAISIILAPLVIIVAKIWWRLAKHAWSITI